MAVANRKFGWDVTVFSPGANALAIFKNGKLSLSVETDFARATNDTASGGTSGWRYPAIKSCRWTIECEAVVDGLPSLVEAANTGLAVAANSSAGVVAVTLTGGGLAFTGNAVYQSAELDLPDGPASQRVTLTGNGPLVAT